MSLRRRLLAGLLAVAVVLVITNVVLSRTFESVLLDRVDRQLVEVASRSVFGGGRLVGRGPRAELPLQQQQTLSEYFIAIGGIDLSAFTQLSSALTDAGEAPPRLEPAALASHLGRPGVPPRPFTAPATSGGQSWRLVSVEYPQRGVIVVGVRLAELEQTVGRIRGVQIGGTIALLGALGLVSWWMLRLGVHPIEDMARTADAIAAGDLSQRVDHPGPGTEAGRLGMALNAMLGRIEGSFRDLEASESRVRRFAADASHELRTPLTSIRGYAELWRAGGLRGKGELEDAMGRMEDEAARMGSLVEDLLLLARLDQKRPLERAPVRLDLIAADAVADARAVEPDRTIELSAQPVVVDGDEARLRQVVSNLLANTRTHTPLDAAVTVTVVASNGTARLDVADTGHGMVPEVAAQVFERFYRADAVRSRDEGGTGLGLSIVAAVAAAHGGSARVESAPGVGSRFVVELPLANL